jgi:hypothetical protein
LACGGWGSTDSRAGGAGGSGYVMIVEFY